MVNSDLFWAKVNKDGPVWNGSSCWVWTASFDRHGYGQFRVDKRTKIAHRVSWVLAGRELPPRPLMLDHMCRNRACVNHEHLRVATNRENQICGIGPIALNAAKSHCDNGHEFTDENVYTETIDGHAHRKCRACNSDRADRYRQAYRSVERKQAPSADVLKALMSGGSSWMAIARLYGVSDVAVRKWAKKHGLID